MKIKNFLHHITKIPLLCLITITVFLSDSIYDGILPWPSPFHISLSYVDDSFHFSAGWNSGRSAKGTVNAPDTDKPADSDSPLDVADGSDPISGHDSDAVETVSDHAGADSETIPDHDGSDGETIPDPVDTDGETIPGSVEADGETSSDPVDAGVETIPDPVDTDGEISSGHDGGDETLQQTGADSGVPEDPDNAQVILGEDGLPLVSYIQVENDYFDDAVFIGDSRTRSLQLYADLENTTFLADTGLTIYTVLDKKLTPSTLNTKTTVTDYLSEHQFKKVYVMLGINEIGTGTAESFCRSYSEVLDKLRELQPDAIIYLQAILHISESKDKEHTYINNAAIIERNEALKSLADNEHIFFLDSNPSICDENGYLIDDYTFDGVHLQAKFVYLWTDYLKQHAIKQADPPYQPSFAPPPQPQAVT